jgi:hypothetical protein
MGIRNALADLESTIESRGYKITVNSKAGGDCVVTLTHQRKGHKFEGLATYRNTFTYRTALEQADARMRQYEDRFAS